MNVAYYRVSTAKQGQSGLGLEAQRAAVIAHLGTEPDKEYTDIESGKNANRPQLQAALRECQLTGAVLVIAKLDRLSRSAGFLLELRDSEVEFICCDMPNANRLTIGIMALMAEHEREAISERTKAALAAAKARGVKLGNPKWRANFTGEKRDKAAAKLKAYADDFAAKIEPTIREMMSAGNNSYAGMAHELNTRGVKTARGGKWHASSVSNLIRRLQACTNRL